MNADLIDSARLTSSGLVRGIERHAEIGSTNDRAIELAADAALDCPFLVFAEQQTAGRGRGSNRWWSAPGSLTFSLIVDARDLRLSREAWPPLTLAAGLAVCEAIEPRVPGHPVRVKWPNDVYLAGKKLGGILVEAPAVSLPRLVIGIGLNVNNSLAAAPPEIREHATSLFEVTGQSLPRDVLGGDLLSDLLGRLRDRLAQVADRKPEVIHGWRKYCLLTGRRVRLDIVTRQIEGLCLGIDAEGQLLIQTAEQTERFASGTVVRFD